MKNRVIQIFNMSKARLIGHELQSYIKKFNLESIKTDKIQ